MDTYFFYAYYRNPKVTIHKATCRFCNQGKGMQPNKCSCSTGRWRGSFSSFELALTAAQEVGKRLGVEPTYCQRCMHEAVAVSGQDELEWEMTTAVS
ncbi:MULTISPECIES: hypothetical protein [unclassified Spirosoma]|uniref:hypothetical protein n=1 Tax=unclassified Spirosoma TaxID=2621999 RepID=UPI000B1C7F44|nr:MULTISPECIES: hypothetical protein [unclassified Spirosoma]MBN8821269.1 hypothetical protein [Spirosoma sp.]